MVLTSLGGAALASGVLIPTAGKPAAFPPFDPATFPSQLFWLVLSFGALYFLLARIALPRIGEVIEERRDRIQRDLDEAARMKGETDAALKSYEQSMTDARGKAQAHAKETRDKLAAESEAERQRVESQLTKKLVETEQRIAANKAKALGSVEEIAASSAADIVAALTGRTVTPDEVRQALAGRRPAAGQS